MVLLGLIFSRLLKQTLVIFLDLTVVSYNRRMRYCLSKKQRNPSGVLLIVALASAPQVPEATRSPRSLLSRDQVLAFEVILL